MCFVHIRTMAAGVVSGGVLLALGTQGIANAAPVIRAASPATSGNCVAAEVASSSPGTPTQTPTSPASSTSQPAQSHTPTQAPATTSPPNTPAAPSAKTSTTGSSSPSSSTKSPSSANSSSAAATTTTSATLSAFYATPAGPTSSAGSSPSSSASSSSPAPTGELCVSVIQPASGIQRGQAGTFTVQVWSKNWTSGGSVTVELATQPTSVTPAFTGQDSAVCTPAAKSPPVECTMTVPATQTQALQVQVPVASSATSVSKVTLEAIAVPTAVKLTGALSASATAQVTAAPAKKQSSSPASSASAAKRSMNQLAQVGAGSFNIGQLPGLNGAASSLIGVGNASGLFPKISPSAAPSPAPGANGGRKALADPPSKLSLLPLGMPVVTAQLIGLLALGVAFLLALTRLSLRRTAKKPHRS